MYINPLLSSWSLPTGEWVNHPDPAVHMYWVRTIKLTDCRWCGHLLRGIQFSSVQLLSPTLCNSMNCSITGLPVHHQLPKFTQTQVHRVGDAIQPSHPLSSPSPSAPNPSQHQSLFQRVNSSHEVAKKEA